jgi:hypothetical protein
MKNRKFAIVLALAVVLGGVAFWYYTRGPKPLNLSGGNPEILNNPFEQAHAWLQIKRTDGKSLNDEDMSPDKFIMDVDFEPQVTKFANGTYRITLKVPQRKK